MTHKSMQKLLMTVYRLGRISDDNFQRQMELAGFKHLQPSVGLVLLPLLENDGMTLTEIAKSLHMKAPTITVIANRLENSGWVRRERSTSDRRQVHLYLTAKGKEIAGTITQIYRKIVQQMASGIDFALIHDANSTLQKAIRNIRDGV